LARIEAPCFHRRPRFVFRRAIAPMATSVASTSRADGLSIETSARSGMRVSFSRGGQVTTSHECLVPAVALAKPARAIFHGRPSQCNQSSESVTSQLQRWATYQAHPANINTVNQLL
jgi:hypothetical protein